MHTHAVEKINHWLTLLANLGVLVGIGFLVYEIRQNTHAIQSQTRATLYTGAQEELWKNMEFPDVTLNFQTTDHKLSPEEKIRLDAWLTAAMMARQFAWSEYINGNLDQTQWNSEQQITLLVLGTKRNRWWWKNLGSKALNSEFVALTNQLIANQPESRFVENVLAIE